MPPSDFFILLIVAGFISIILEVIVVKTFSEKLGIEKEAKWMKAVLISTIASIFVLATIGQTVAAFLSVLLLELSIDIPFVSLSPSILIPIILRVWGYSLASTTWKTLTFKKKLLFCCCSCGLVNLLLSVLLGWLMVSSDSS